MEAHIVQPSSIPVDRRARRAKSDGIDAELLLRTLLAWFRGEPRVCSMVPIPNEADEDERRRVREREELVADRISLVNRIAAVLATLGVRDYNPVRRDRRARLEALRTALGDPLPPHARARILRILDRLELVCALGARGFSVRRRLRGWLRPAPTSPILRRSPASKREEKAVTSGRSTECPAMGDTVRELLDIISAGRNCRSGRAGAVKPCASGAPLTRPCGFIV